MYHRTLPLPAQSRNPRWTASVSAGTRRDWSQDTSSVEIDQADLLTGYLYPAMARTYRAVGAQFAAMFAYDMLRTAPFNLGWQTHYLNLVHTPKKAVSAVIAAEAMRRLPRFRSASCWTDMVRG